MTALLNHTIVQARDRDASARFLTEILGLEPPGTYGPFAVVELGNDVSLDYMTSDRAITSQHYAFLVSESEFDAIHARIVERGLDFWADPFHRQPGQVNTNDGGRGVYWDDPNGHRLEILTVPYGG
jgi:catechol 2,3-dioxygenase-like lactoylglutathione lyase family enzyme